MHIAPSEQATAIDAALPRIKANISSNSFNSALTNIITSYTPDGPELRKSVADAVCSMVDNHVTILDDSLKSLHGPVDPDADYFPELHDLVYTLAQYAVDQVIAEHPTADAKRLLGDFMAVSAVVMVYMAVRCHSSIKSVTSPD